MTERDAVTSAQRKSFIESAAMAHSNLNVFAIVVSVLEGGAVYGDAHKAAQRIVNICLTEQRRQLNIYDRMTAKALEAK